MKQLSRAFWQLQKCTPAAGLNALRSLTLQSGIQTSSIAAVPQGKSVGKDGADPAEDCLVFPEWLPRKSAASMHVQLLPMLIKADRFALCHPHKVA